MNTSEIFAHDGTSQFEGKWTTLTAARSFDSNLISPPHTATHFIRYTGGTVADVIVGDTLTGETSSATATVVANVIEQGAFGTSNTEGWLFLKDVSGTFQAETCNGTAGGHVIIASDVHPLLYKSLVKCLLITVETAAVHVTVSSLTPTVTSGTNLGVSMATGTSWVIRGTDNIRNFKAINAVAASGAILKYVLYFDQRGKR